MSVLEGRCGVAVTAETTTQHNRSHHTLYKMISRTHTRSHWHIILSSHAAAACTRNIEYVLDHRYNIHCTYGFIIIMICMCVTTNVCLFFCFSLSLYHKWMLKRKLQWQYHFLLLLLLAWVHISSVYRDRFRCIFFLFCCGIHTFFFHCQ